MKTMIGAGLLAVGLFSFSTEGLCAGPLPPGKPAGTKAAISSDDAAYILLGTAAVSIVVFVSIFDFGSSTTGTSS